MSETNRLPATYRDHAVWASLSHYIIGPEDTALSFTARLARENGWSTAHAARVVDEYRKFCFLAVTGDREATPSDAVDQAWHLHLTYSRDYWERFCPEILGRPLHHGPTAGGVGERGRFFEQYADTLKRYEQVFGEAPPADIWPGGARRLIDDPRARRVHPRDAFIIPRRRALSVLLATLIAAAALLAFAVSR